MPCLIQDKVIVATADNQIITQVGQKVYGYPIVIPNFILVGGVWYEVGIQPLRTDVTDGNGQWSFTLPWPTETNPSTTKWRIQLSDGTVWEGLVPEGLNGPLTMRELKANHGWINVVVPDVSNLPLYVSGPTGPPGSSAFAGLNYPDAASLPNPVSLNIPTGQFREAKLLDTNQIVHAGATDTNWWTTDGIEV